VADTLNDLRRLFEQRDRLSRELVEVDQNIRRKANLLSEEQGLRVPMRIEQARQQVIQADQD
jgi:hypothetical protein